MNISIFNIHKYLAWIGIILGILSLIFHGDTYLDQANRIYIILFFVLYLVLYSPKSIIKYPILAYYGLFIFSFIGQRLLFICFYSAHNWEHNYYEPTMLNGAISEIILYIIVLHVNLIFLNKYFIQMRDKISSSINNIPGLHIKYKVAIILFFISTILSIISTNYSGLQGSNNSINVNILTRYLTRFINPEVYLIFIIAVYHLSIRKIQGKKKSISLVMMYYVAFTIISGSKEGFFGILILIALYYLFFDVHARINIDTKSLFYSLLILVTSSIAFLFIGYIRARYWQNVTADMNSIIASPNISFLDVFGSMSRRLSIVEDLIKVSHWSEFGFTDITEYVNVRSAFFLSLDSIIPTTLYPTLLKSQFALSLMINNLPDYSRSNAYYVGYWWGFVGYHKFLFGLIPGLAVMSVFLNITVYYMRLIFQLSSPAFQIIFFFYFISNFFYYFIGFFGYEHILSFYLDGLLRIIFNYYLLVALSSIFIYSKSAVYHKREPHNLESIS